MGLHKAVAFELLPFNKAAFAIEYFQSYFFSIIYLEKQVE
jgi:hypothetical protein